MDSIKRILDKIKADPRYQRNIEYGEPRSGHPEGKVKIHIADLEENLEMLCRKKEIQPGDYWKLKFMIHVHDTFKEEAEKASTLYKEISHATLAREYAGQYTDDMDLLNMIQYHDDNYKLWQEYQQDGGYKPDHFQHLLGVIQNWDLFLMFIIIDGCTKGKNHAKIGWFINEVRIHKQTLVDETWILQP